MFLPINTDNGNIEHGAGAGGGGILDGELLWNDHGGLSRPEMHPSGSDSSLWD